MGKFGSHCELGLFPDELNVWPEWLYVPAGVCLTTTHFRTFAGLLYGLYYYMVCSPCQVLYCQPEVVELIAKFSAVTCAIDAPILGSEGTEICFTEVAHSSVTHCAGVK